MMRKNLSLIICLIMILALTPSSYADDGTTSITFISSSSLANEISDWNSSCRLACTTMALNTLGIDVKAKEIWELNGGSSWMMWNRVAEKYNVTISGDKKVTGNTAEKEQKLKEVLHSLPDTQQFLLISVNAKFIANNEVTTAGHMVIMFIDQLGNLKIHDPGTPSGNNTTIEKTYMMAQYGSNDEKWENVTAYRIIRQKDVTPPVFTDGPWVTVHNDSSFTIGFRTTDSESAVKEVYARIVYDSTNGLTSTTCTGTYDGDYATITVNADNYEGQLKNFWFSCAAKDVHGNEAVADSDVRTVSLYLLTISGKKDCGRFKTTVENAPLCIVPYEEYGDKDMVSVRVSKGYDNLFVAGKHVNERGETWYFVEPNLWIKSDYVSRKSNDSEIWAKVSQYVNYEFFCVGGSYVPAENSVETYLRTYKSSNIAVPYTDDEEPVEEKPAYTVSFDACGGYCGRPSYSVTYESQYGELPVPKRKGYHFDGWFTQSESGTQITSSDVYDLNGDQTLYAHWTRIILEQGACGGNLSYILYGDGQLDITGSGDMSSAAWTASNANKVEIVSLPEGLTSLCAEAFGDCTNLVEINLPESILSIDDRAFENCVLLETVHLPANLSQLGLGAFHNCESIEKINIPSAVTTKGLTGENNVYYQGPFLGCTALTEITFDEGITTIPEGLFADCVFTEIELPSTVASISLKAFTRCSKLERVTFHEGLESIGQNAFRECVSLKEVQLPEGLSLLDIGAFYNCTSLQRVNIPKDIRTGNLAGENTGYLQGPFLGCTSLTEIAFDDGITTIPEGLFADCIFTDIVIPSTVTAISERAFIRCNNLTIVTLPSNLQTIGESAFSKCTSLENIVLPSGLKTIGYRAFQECTRLTEVQLPAELSLLDNGAFYNCTSLQRVNIPKDIRTGNLAGENTGYLQGPFLGCTSLTEIAFDDGITTIPEGLFADCTFSDIEIPSTVTAISDKAFTRCANLKSVTLPESLQSIGQNVFNGCSSLPKIEMPANVEYIRVGAFRDCSSLTEIVWNSALKLIEDSAFRNCDSLTSVMIPDTITSIGGNAFYDCDTLTRIVIPDSVTSIGSRVFWDCDALTDVTLGNGITTIPASAFEHCNMLESIVVPYRVSSIGNNAFKNCIAFKSITLPRAVTSIGVDVFSYPDSLTIYGVPGTYAETYANQNSIRFVPQEVNATEVSLSQSTVTINKNQSIKLGFHVEPANFTDAITWKSNNTGIATISNDGTLKGVGIGAATIKLQVGSVSASCDVTVVQPVTSISLNAGSKTLNALDTFQLTATVYPSDAYNKTYTWSNSDESVAAVDENGLVTALKKGTAKITASAQDGSGVTKSCTVTVANSAIICKTLAELESSHNYPDNCQDFWVYTVPGANSLSVLFDNRTNVEDGFDYLKVYNGSGTLIDTFTGTELAGQVVQVAGDTVRIQLVSDESGNEWGFKVVSVGLEPDFVLPTELTIIGEEAFSGGAFTYVKLSEKTTTIEKNAFANCPNLTCIYIPEATTNIDSQAFGNKQGLTIFGKAGSTAQIYAQAHDYFFIAVT